MAGALFVADEDEVHAGVIEGVEGGEDGAAGVTEDVGDAVLGEHLDEDLGAGLADVAGGGPGRMAHDRQTVGIDFFLDDLQVGDLVGSHRGVWVFGGGLACGGGSACSARPRWGVGWSS